MGDGDNETGLRFRCCGQIFVLGRHHSRRTIGSNSKRPMEAYEAASFLKANVRDSQMLSSIASH